MAGLVVTYWAYKTALVLSTQILLVTTQVLHTTVTKGLTVAEEVNRQYLPTLMFSGRGTWNFDNGSCPCWGLMTASRSTRIITTRRLRKQNLSKMKKMK